MKRLSILLLLASAGSVFGAASSSKKSCNNEAAVARYRYTDCSTWKSLEELVPYACELATKCESGRIVLNTDTLHAMAVVLFHLAWNMQDYSAAHKVLGCLEQQAYACPELLSYLKGKLFFFEGNYAEALKAFALGDKIASTDEKRVELRDMLKVMGTCTDVDAEGIEFDLLGAVLANDRANALLAQGEVEAAITAFNKAFEIQKEACTTTKHANVAYTVRCLAAAYAKQGNLELAKEKYQEALSICDAVYDNTEHPEVIAVRKGLQALTQ